MSRPARRARRLPLAIAAAIAVVTVVLYAPVRDYHFVNYDDPEYVVDNGAVAGGLTARAMAWAFTESHSANWHPLTWLSHMLDCELFGLAPGPHHLMNVALHTLASVALFAVLASATGAPWPSAWIAALFALHPAHVESVAWVSERKDVLCGLFYVVTVGCWVRYVRRPSAGRYALVVLAATLALLAKPMAVSLPVVLLLVDVWPLGRVSLEQAPLRALVRASRDKVPILVLALAVATITVVVQSDAGAVASLADVPLADRVANAVVAYVRYLRMLAWPSGLAVFYPLELPLPWPRVAAAALVLVATTVAVVRAARRRPYLAVGWGWYVVTLVPVIGIVRAGEQALADRFTYLPSIGVFLMLAFGAAEVARRTRTAALALATLGVVSVAAYGVAARTQLAHWTNSETLFRRALAVTRDNYVAHTNLAIALEGRGMEAAAFDHHAAALRIKPGYAKAHVNVGRALARRGDRQQAAAHYAEALRLDPGHAMAHYNWGLLLAGEGRLDEAEQHYREALRLQPSYARARNNLGWTLAASGRRDEAIAEYREALRIAPALAPAHNNLAVALEEAGRPDEALEHYRAAVRLAPTDPKGHFNLGMVLVGRGELAEAERELRIAAALAPRLPEPHLGLARLLAQTGRREEAAAEYRATLRLAPGTAEAERELASLGVAAPAP